MISTSPDQDLVRRARGARGRRRARAARRVRARRGRDPAARTRAATTGRWCPDARRRGGRHRRRRLDHARHHARARVPGRRGRAVRVGALGGPARSTSATRPRRPARSARRPIQGFDLALFSAGGATSRRVGAALRRGRRRGGRQLVALAHERRRAARRVRGQPRGARRPPRDHRQPELLDHADGGGAEADPRRGRHRAARDHDLPVGVRHRPARGRGAARPVRGAARRATSSRRRRCYPHQIAFNVLPRGGLPGRRRLHRRGAQARQRDAQDPRRSRTIGVSRHVHARAGLHRPLASR